MESRKPLDAQAVSLMVMMCLCMGMQQIALKATVADISPVLQIALRSGIAAVLVVVLILLRREKLPFSRDNWQAGCIIGFLFALEYLLLGEALRFTSASHAVVLLYTAPIFTALGLHWKLPSERMAALQWLGIIMAFVGIVVSFSGHGAPAGTGWSNMLFGDLLALAAGLSWGMTTVVVRTSSLSNLPAKLTLLYQLVAAFVLLSLCALLLGQTYFNPTPMALAALAFQSIVVSFLVLLLWFWLLRHYLASRLGTLSFMTPLFGVALGAWLLNETIESGFLFGSLLVIAGIMLVSGHNWLKQIIDSRSR